MPSATFKTISWHHCQEVLHTIFAFGGLFLCFVFFFLRYYYFRLCQQAFASYLQIFYGFGSYFSAKMEQLILVPFMHTNASRLLPFRSLIVCPFSASNIHVWFATGFHVGFKLPLLLFGRLRVLIRVLVVRCLLCVSEHLFFFQFVRFPFVQVSSRFCSFACCLWCTLDFLRLLFLSFPICLQSSSDCPGFHCCGFYKFAVQFSVPSTGPLLGPKIVEIFCQVLEGPPECRKK